MFELNWGVEKLWQSENHNLNQVTPVLKRSDVKSVVKLVWEEHCVECAIPECYKSCELYVPRSDGRCARFTYGIVPNYSVSGQYSFGADLKFRKWAKLEANLDFSFLAPIIPHLLEELFIRLPLNTQTYLLNRIRKAHKNDVKNIDAFVLECYSSSSDSFQVFIEYFTESYGVRTIKFRHACNVSPGHNFFEIPFSAFAMTKLEGYVSVYLDNSNVERRLVFTWIDFIRYKTTKISAGPSLKQSNKIKCVAWDLDNTLWNGILVEDTKPVLKSEAKQLIMDFDSRGIIQTILSKNHHDDAMLVLTSMGIDKYFLHPAINWGQKSENLKEIALKLNIGLENFAVIDDSAFERMEIRNAIPQVRVYDEKQIGEIIRYPEFDVPVTDAASTRRLSYIQEIERTGIQESFVGSYDDFIRSCKMHLEVYTPNEEQDLKRLLELIHRSNQLNLSSNRYSAENFYLLLATTDVRTLALRCRDRFGNYGIVGFASINFANPVPILNDFLLSCRVARKKVEHTFIYGLIQWLARSGYATLNAQVVKTAKNFPLRQVFSDLPFTTVSEDDAILDLTISTNIGTLSNEWMQLEWNIDAVTLNRAVF